TLLNEPGVRRDPPMSDPSPEAWMPAAIAAAAPPEEPAADFDVSYGFTVVPNSGLKVWEPAANSGTFDFPVVTTPAARRREMMSESRTGTFWASSGEPYVVSSPAVSCVSLWVIGTPCRGPSRSPREKDSSAAAAAA